MNFFTTTKGRQAHLFTLENNKGFQVQITDMGGSIVAIKTPDKNGNLVDVALGYKDPAQYEPNGPFLGALIGRVANRITNGKFVLDGKTYNLEINDGNGRPNTLHGGQSYGRRLWNATQVDRQTLKLTLESPDGDAGFPGKLNVQVVYRVTDNNEIEIDYTANTDKTTVVNLTNHTYFNLNGENANECKDHKVWSIATGHTQVDKNLSATGVTLPVENSPFDLSKGRTFEEIYGDPQLPIAFDDNFVIAGKAGTFRKKVFTIVSYRTGITLEVDTDQPGVQFYMGYWLDGSNVGKSGTAYNRYGAFCLETQLWPDSPNHANFPSPRLEPNQTYKHKTVYRFGILK